MAQVLLCGACMCRIAMKNKKRWMEQTEEGGGKKARASLIYFTDLETRIPSGTVCP